MNQQIRRKLSHITDTLWAGGVTNPVTYIEQISYLIYLKLLDEEESARELQARLLNVKGNGKSLFPNQSERYRWSKWRFKSGKDLVQFVGEQVFSYMSSLVKEEPQIAEYFRDAVLEIRDPHVLKLVIDELDSIDFRKLGTDVKGDIFEYLLTHLGQSALNGHFRTPRQIRTMMVEMVEPDQGDTIFDPACGTGGFLIDAVEFILARYSTDPTEVPIYGEEWLEKKARSKGLLGEDTDIDEFPLPRRSEIISQLKQENPALQTYRKGPGEKLPNWQLLESSIRRSSNRRATTRQRPRQSWPCMTR